MRTLPEGIRTLPNYESLLSTKVSEVCPSKQNDAGKDAGIPKNQVTPKRVPSSNESIEVIAWHYAHGYVEMFFDSLSDFETWQRSGSSYGWKVEAIG